MLDLSHASDEGGHCESFFAEPIVYCAADKSLPGGNFRKKQACDAQKMLKMGLCLDRVERMGERTQTI